MPPSSGHQFQVSSHSLPLRLADISMRQTDNCLPTTKLTRDNCFAVGRSRDEAKRRDVISQPPSQTHRAHTHSFNANICSQSSIGFKAAAKSWFGSSRAKSRGFFFSQSLLAASFVLPTRARIRARVRLSERVHYSPHGTQSRPTAATVA